MLMSVQEPLSPQQQLRQDMYNKKIPTLFEIMVQSNGTDD
jgi:hypothetical protein